MSKLNQDEINNLNRSITSHKIEVVMKILPFVRSSVGYTAELHQTFKGKLTSIFFKLSIK